MLHDHKLSVLVALALLAGLAGLVVLRGGPARAAQSIAIGEERIVAWETLPEMNGEMCQWVPRLRI